MHAVVICLVVLYTPYGREHRLLHLPGLVLVGARSVPLHPAAWTRDLLGLGHRVARVRAVYLLTATRVAVSAR